MTATEAYRNSLKNNGDKEIHRILNDIKDASDRGYTCKSYSCGFKDNIIKQLLDLGYRYIEHNGIMGDFEVLIVWDPCFKKSVVLDNEITYEDLKVK